MVMSRRDRIRLKSEIIQALQYQPEWPIDRVNLVMDEFGLRRLSDSSDGPSASNLIGNETTTPVTRVAAEIRSWLVNLPEFGTSIVYGLISALKEAGNYLTAGAIAEQIAALDYLTSEQFDRLDLAWWSNDQLYGGLLPTRALQPFYQKNESTWPPQRAAAK